MKVDLRSKIRDGRIQVDQGIIAGCAGGGFENICDASDILKGKHIGNGNFTFNVYPASMPIYLELVRNGAFANLIEAGAVIKTAFCGPCFGAGDTPANNAFSIRHSTRNFPNREGSKVQNGQISSVALMDARSIAATAANGGRLTSAAEYQGNYTKPAYFFDSSIYRNRVYDGIGRACPEEPLVFGPNIKDWPAMEALPKNLFLRVVSEIHDPVTTTDELIPSGETSSYRSNPLALAEFALSRKDPAYVGEARKVQALERARLEQRTAGTGVVVRSQPDVPWETFPEATPENTGIGSTIFAVKPGDGSAREQAASCQKVLGGWANIANEYATKRYRSNLINWGMLPLLIPEGELPFAKGDFIFLPDIRSEVENESAEIQAMAVTSSGVRKFTMRLGELTKDERKILLDGCLINYYREQNA